MKTPEIKEMPKKELKVKNSQTLYTIY